MMVRIRIALIATISLAESGVKTLNLRVHSIALTSIQGFVNSRTQAILFLVLKP